MRTVAIGFLLLSASLGFGDRPYQDLHIPQLIEGTHFNLRLHPGQHSFWDKATTKTYSYNKEPFWGPTLVLNKGDEVSLQVTNELSEPTTVHWHGMHLPAKEDGGPHQLIPPGGIWTSKFKVTNNASTYWYHPHPHESTQKQLTLGAGGLIIVRDPSEAKLKLPRTYGVDDIPLVFTSRRFTKTNEFRYFGDSDKYGDYLLCNGTLDPQVKLPAQWVRFRILNAEVERGYILGFKDNRDFYQIGTDGGLLDKPTKHKRLSLMVGERAEIMVDLSHDPVGTSLDLYSYNSNQPFGFPGGEPGYYSPNGSYLNNSDFKLLHIKVSSPIAKHSALLPSRLVVNKLLSENDASIHRVIHINGGGPPDKEFQFGGRYFDMDRVDQVIKVGTTECWKVSNDQVFGHSFHIHDVQFNLLERNGVPVAESERGWKDTVYVPREGSVKFVCRFEDFASDRYAFMYHCHMSNHEDGGLMGQFLVVKDPTKLSQGADGYVHLGHSVSKAQIDASGRLAHRKIEYSYQQLSVKPKLLYFIERDCPCSRDAATYINHIALSFGDRVTVNGYIDGSAADATQWSKGVFAKFPVFPDPKLKTAKRYRQKYSASMILVNNQGFIERAYPGYSLGWLREICAKLNGMTKLARHLSFDGAPKNPRAGCVLVMNK